MAESGSITQAAREVGISQSALSRQLQVFEDELGLILFNRGGKSIMLTEAGKVVQCEGKKLMRTVDLTWERILREVRGPEMKIGFAPTLAAGLIEQAMATFSQVHPAVRVRLMDGNTGEMLTMLRTRELDFVIEMAHEDRDVSWQILRERRLRVAIPKAHVLARKRVVKAGDLQGERLLLFSRVDYPQYWKEVTGYFESLGLNAKVAGEFDGLESLRLGLEAGLGVAFVAEGSRFDKNVVIRNLQPEPDPIKVGIAHLKNRKLEDWESVFLAEIGRFALR